MLDQHHIIKHQANIIGSHRLEPIIDDHASINDD
jgi:hypothetical protein